MSRNQNVQDKQNKTQKEPSQPIPDQTGLGKLTPDKLHKSPNNPKKDFEELDYDEGIETHPGKGL